MTTKPRPLARATGASLRLRAGYARALDVTLDNAPQRWVLRTDNAAVLAVSLPRTAEFALLRADPGKPGDDKQADRLKGHTLRRGHPHFAHWRQHAQMHVLDRFAGYLSTQLTEIQRAVLASERYLLDEMTEAERANAALIDASLTTPRHLEHIPSTASPGRGSGRCSPPSP